MNGKLNFEGFHEYVRVDDSRVSPPTAKIVTKVDDMTEFILIADILRATSHQQSPTGFYDPDAPTNAYDPDVVQAFSEDASRRLLIGSINSEQPRE